MEDINGDEVVEELEGGFVEFFSDEDVVRVAEEIGRDVILQEKEEVKGEYFDPTPQVKANAWEINFDDIEV